ncbi:ATP-dependent DNA helicase PIF1, partial [Trachymyrmex cornetzi]
YIGPMNISCIHCNAKHFIAEKVANRGVSFHDCCNHGAIYIKPLPKPPKYMQNLFNGNHTKSNEFFNQIRCYNNSFAFASFNANLITFKERRPGPYCFKIQGQIYYQINTSLYAEPNENPTNGQLFIVDSNEAVEHRINKNSKLDLEILKKLEHIMRKSNVFAQSYLMMYEELKKQEQSEMECGKVMELQLTFTLRPGMDRRRYNIQRSNEVAIVFSTNASGEIPDSYVTIRNKSTKILQQVSSMDPNVEPWIYPLFYIYGTQGWHRNLKKLNSERRITRAQYIRYCMAIRNEFNIFLLGRRLFQQKIQDKSHIVLRLPVHLPNEQNIIIENECVEDAFFSTIDQVTMLIDYFALNMRDEEARNYLYIDIPRYYSFRKIKINGKNVSRWTKRNNYFNCIGRIYTVSPTKIELFHLRLLLLTIKGATSFQNLKVVNGETHQTFSAACLALGLIEDDDEWNRAMHEAVKWMMPQQLRRLFSRILIHCNPLYPEKLWESFKDALSEDYVRKNGILNGLKKTCNQINNMLLSEGKSFADFLNMEQLINNDEVTDYLTEQESEIGMKQYKQLNDKQKEIIDIILDRLDNNSANSHCFYIDGPGGSGKTFIYTTIYYLTKIRNKRVCTMAFTGIAATLLPCGKTVHKTFGLPAPLFEDSTSAIKIQSKEAKYLKEIDIFIWDEATMAPRYALEIIDRTLRDFTKNKLPFGGKIIIMGGDFRQLLPIKTHSTRNEIVDLSIKFSSTWKYFEKFTLSKNMRVLSFKNNLSPTCLPPHELRLRPNSVIMLIRNLSINEGLCNGTRLLVEEFANHLLKCKIITGDKAGEIVFLNRITLYCENIYPFTFTRRQFPVRLAFAMTINKSQGQTFEKVGIDLRKDVFNHGQLYVAFSRVRTWQGLKVFLGNQRENRFVKNWVYKEIFS